jgi:ankyrin repeat protein
MAAVLARSLESVKALLAAGASVDFRDDEGQTALFYHEASGGWGQLARAISLYSEPVVDPRVVQALLAAGADVRARAHDGRTALHALAAADLQSWTVDSARQLLQRGADARALDADGRTPAQCVPAASHGGELHRLLLEAEA